MKRIVLASVLACLGLALVAWPGAVEAVDDNMQRFFRIHNQLNVPIYPVITAAQQTNCAAVYSTPDIQLRIIVNGSAGRGKGVLKDETVLVKIPKTEAGCGQKGLFYNAARILIFTAAPEALDVELKKYNKATQTSTEINPPWKSDLCFTANGATNLGAACWVGQATADYDTDAPAQLNEYTVISRVGAGDSPNGPNDPNGTSNFGFNISYVDSIHLPVAMGLGGALEPYLGTPMSGALVETKTTNFLQDADAQWSGYAAFSKRQFEGATSTDGTNTPIAPTTAFRNLVPRTDAVPAARIILEGTREAKNPDGTPAGIPGSGYTFNVWDGVTTKVCQPQPPNPPQLNEGCRDASPGNCCPGPPGGNPVTEVFAGCCDTPTNAKIDGLTRDRPGQGQNLVRHNRTLTSLTARWLLWNVLHPNGYSCNNIAAGGPLDSPVVQVDKQYFCTAFKQSVNFLWEQFTKYKTTDRCETLKTAAYSVTNPNDPYNQCIVSAIIGFTIDDTSTGNNPAACLGKCPGPTCPKTCTDQLQRVETTIATLRSVPFTGYGPQATCQGCPSDVEGTCPAIACIAPVNHSTAAKEYHYDKWLHFWAPHVGRGSAYNVNPYTRFVHDKDAGVNAVAYSYSIDDFYGFYGGDGTTLIVNVGGDAGLDNRDQRDPFNKYTVGFGAGYHSVSVCGRQFVLNGQPLGFPITFYKPDGVNADGTVKYTKKQYCLIEGYVDAAKTQKLVALIQLINYQAPNRFTGEIHTVEALSGGYAADNAHPTATHTWANRFDNAIAEADQYCVEHSTLANKDQKCKGVNLSPVINTNDSYPGITDCASGNGPSSQTCGKPLIKVTFPGIP